MTTETNEREKAQAERQEAPAVLGVPWVFTGRLVGDADRQSFQVGGLAPLVSAAELADAVHVAAGILEGEGYVATAYRLRAAVGQPTERGGAEPDTAPG